MANWWYLKIGQYQTPYSQPTHHSRCVENGVNQSFFKAHFPAWITENQKVGINELELLAFTIAKHKWAGNMKNKNILAYCDNQLTAEVINSGKARNRFTQACLRDIAFNLAVVNRTLKVIYIASKCNWIPDSLSRWSEGGYQRYTKEIIIQESDFILNDDWSSL